MAKEHVTSGSLLPIHFDCDQAWRGTQQIFGLSGGDALHTARPNGASLFTSSSSSQNEGLKSCRRRHHWGVDQLHVPFYSLKP